MEDWYKTSKSYDFWELPKMVEEMSSKEKTVKNQIDQFIQEKENSNKFKKQFEDIIDSGDGQELDKILGLLSFNEGDLKSFPWLSKQSKNWKSLQVEKILQNPSITTNTLEKFTKYILLKSPHSILNISNDIISVINHPNCPENIADLVFEYLEKNPNRISDACGKHGVIMVLFNFGKMTENAMSKLLNMKVALAYPPILEFLGRNPKAPTHVAVNYVLQSDAIENINKINHNVDAIIGVLDVVKTLEGCSRETVQKLLDNEQTPTRILFLIVDYLNKNLDIINHDKQFKDYYEKLLLELKVHPNSPFSNDGELSIIDQKNANYEFRKKSIVDFFEHHYGKDEQTNLKILKILEEFRYDDPIMSELYEYARSNAKSGEISV